MYHRFSEGENSFAISRNVFREHLKYLTKRYSIIPLSEVVDYLKKNKSLPDNVAALTIDDGYVDAYEIAFPVLKEYGVPATIFVVTDFLDKKDWVWTDKMRYVMSRIGEKEINLQVGDKRLLMNLNGSDSRFKSAARINDILKRMNEDDKNKNLNQIASSFEIEIPDLPTKEFAPVSWQHAREMDKNNVAVESHTVTHPILTNVDDAQLQTELTESRVRLKAELERDANIFCYPNGNYDARVRGAVEQAGYASAVTTVEGFNEKGVDPFSLKRFSAEFDIEHFAQTTSGFELWKNNLRAR